MVVIQLPEGQVVLPKGFKLEQEKVDGELRFKLNPGLELPYTDEFLAEIEAEKGRRVRDHSLEVNTLDLANLTLAALAKALPDYFSPKFYKALGFDFGHKLQTLPEGSLDLAHTFNFRELANLAVVVHSPESFLPTVDERIVRRPKIQRCSLEGYVTVPIDLPKVNGRGNYTKDLITKPIIEALLTGDDVVLSDTGYIREGFRQERNHRLYVKVNDPTVDRMRSTVAEVGAIAEYMQEHQDVLAVVASEVSEIYGIQVEGARMVNAFSEAVGQLARFRKLVPRLPFYLGVEEFPELLAEAERSRFAEVNSVLGELSKDCPKGLVEYAVPKRS